VNQSPTTSVPGCANCRRLERELYEIRQELEELRRQINRNSGNSSVPPSANPPWAPRPVNKKPSGRKPGGQPGHEGHHRALLAVEQVDEVVKHRPGQCRHCGAELAQQLAGRVVHRHQVSELPRRAVRITEHQALACTCACCGQVSVEQIPAAVTRSVVGARLSAAISFASARMHGSRRAVEQMLQDVLGAPLALGTVIAREREMAQALALPYREAKAAIGRAPAKNVDETGWKGAGKCLWLAASRTLAVFYLDPSRNRDAMHRLLGKTVRGTICTDRYGVYQAVDLKQRGLCWSHLKRDFQSLAEQSGSKEVGDEGLAICAAVFEAWGRFDDQTIGRGQLQEQVNGLRQRMGDLLERGRASSHTRAAKFCAALQRLEAALWTFAYVEGIEPTNNHAERMLRPAVMWRKQSLGSHSTAGCRFVERMLTALQTLKLQGRAVLDYLQEAIHALRHGLSPPSLLPA
jgi:transposase